MLCLVYKSKSWQNSCSSLALKSKKLFFTQCSSTIIFTACLIYISPIDISANMHFHSRQTALRIGQCCTNTEEAEMSLGRAPPHPGCRKSVNEKTFRARYYIFENSLLKSKESDNPGRGCTTQNLMESSGELQGSVEPSFLILKSFLIMPLVMKADCFF